MSSKVPNSRHISLWKQTNPCDSTILFDPYCLDTQISSFPDNLVNGDIIGARVLFLKNINKTTRIIGSKAWSCSPIKNVTFPCELSSRVIEFTRQKALACCLFNLCNPESRNVYRLEIKVLVNGEYYFLSADDEGCVLMAYETLKTLFRIKQRFELQNAKPYYMVAKTKKKYKKEIIILFILIILIILIVYLIFF